MAKAAETARRRPVAKERYGALLDLLSSSSAASETLASLVSQAIGHFEAGSDPDSVYREFDIGRFASIILLDRRSAANALYNFRGRSGEEKLAACMFVSTAIIAINDTDPHFARLSLAHIIRKGAGDQEFDPLSKIVLLSIAETAYGIEGADPTLVSLAQSCLKRLNQ